MTGKGFLLSRFVARAKWKCVVLGFTVMIVLIQVPGTSVSGPDTMTLDRVTGPGGSGPTAAPGPSDERGTPSSSPSGTGLISGRGGGSGGGGRGGAEANGHKTSTKTTGTSMHIETTESTATPTTRMPTTAPTTAAEAGF